jgi:hypothetical protein
VFVLRSGDKTQWLEQGVVEMARRRYAVPVSELTPACGDGVASSAARLTRREPGEHLRPRSSASHP